VIAKSRADKKMQKDLQLPLTALEKDADKAVNVETKEPKVTPAKEASPIVSLREEDTNTKTGSSGWSLSSAKEVEKPVEYRSSTSYTEDVPSQRRRMFV
jgi:hypothetical protein